MSISKLESDIGKGGRRNKRTMVYSAVVLMVVGLGFVSVGIGLLQSKGKISADTNDVASPPMPTNPTATKTPATPSNPGSDADNPPTPTGPSGQIDETKWAFPSGWSIINGRFIEGGNMGNFSQEGLILYSFNDPQYPNRSWSTYPWGESARTDVKNITPYSPFGYYVYNPGTSSVTVDFGPRTPVVRDGIIFARGWHLMYWPDTAVTRSDLLSKIKIKYQDGSELSALDAISSKYHRASIKIYTIANENVVDPSSAIKELTETNTDTTISSIPARSYFWLYLRRTKDRVVDVTISS